MRLDQLPLRGLVALVLAPCELALLGRRQQAAVADLAHVELERVLRRLGDCDDDLIGFLGLFGLISLLPPAPPPRVVEGRQELEVGLGGCSKTGSAGFGSTTRIGVAAARLEDSVVNASKTSL